MRSPVQQFGSAVPVGQWRKSASASPLGLLAVRRGGVGDSRGTLELRLGGVLVFYH